MKTRSYLKHAALTVLADAAAVNLGLFLGLAARYAVLVGLGEAPNIPALHLSGSLCGGSS